MSSHSAVNRPNIAIRDRSNLRRSIDPRMNEPTNEWTAKIISRTLNGKAREAITTNVEFLARFSRHPCWQRYPLERSISRCPAATARCRLHHDWYHGQHCSSNGRDNACSRAVLMRISRLCLNHGRQWHNIV